MKKGFFEIKAVDGSIHIFRWDSIDWVTMDNKTDVVTLHIRGESVFFPGKVGKAIWEKWISIATEDLADPFEIVPNPNQLK